MRKAGIIVVALLLVCAVNTHAIDAVGSVFGHQWTARTIGQGHGDFGGGVGIADATSFYGSFTYGLSDYMDGRIRAGLYDPGEGADAELCFAIDIKYQLFDMMDAVSDHPFDLALDGRLEYLGGDFVSALEIGGGGTISYPFHMTNGQTITPYGRLNLRIERISFDWPAGFDGDDSESNLKFGLNAGVAWKLTPAMSLFGEFQLDGNDGGFFGISFNVM